MSRLQAVVWIAVILCAAGFAAAQPSEPPDPLVANWTAPPYWTPPPAEHVRAHLGGSPNPERGVGTEGTPETTLAGPLPFFAVTPCRLVDTRNSPDHSYSDGETRVYDFSTNTNCTGLPSTPQAWSLNIWMRVVSHQGYIEAWPDGASQPLVATLVAYPTGLFYSNAAVVATGNGDKIDVYCQYAADVAIDINGYYAATGIVNSIAGLTGVVGMTGGTGISVTTASNTITITNTGGAGGLLPSGSANQTLRSNGSAWFASSVLTNDGTGAVGVSGVLNMPNTTSSTDGVIEFGGNPFIHNYAKAGTSSTNTFVGQSAGNFTMGGTHAYEGNTNTAVGYQALLGDTTGYDNTASGYRSLAANLTGYDNAASGAYSLVTNQSGNLNTATGAGALASNLSGSSNTGIGNQSLASNQTGSNNSAVGYQSLDQNTSGSNNIALGSGAGYATTGNFNIDIGNAGVADEGDTIRIGDANQSNTYIAGIYGVTISGSTVLIDSSGHLGSVSSSLRFKQDVQDMGEASSRLMELRPVTFHYKSDPNGALHYGLIAEEVNDVVPELVVRDATGQIESVAYHEMPAMLLNELQKQRAQIADQAETIRAQQAQLDAQQDELRAERILIAELATRLAALERAKP